MVRSNSQLLRVGLGLLAIGTLVAFVTSACTSRKTRKADMGVPLKEFSAANGRYFPPFVEKFFQGTQDYYKAYPNMAAARSDIRMIEVKELNKEPEPNNEANLSWSADGVYLGFEVLTGNFRKILLKDLIGNYSKELMMLPRGRDNFLEGMVVSSAHSYNAGLRWSRDSTRYAFMSNGGVGEYNIYVGAVGVKEKPIAKSHHKDGYATWNPKSSEIAFVSARSGKGDIYVIDVAEQKVDRLSRSPKVDIFPEWFPSGNGLIYSSGDALNHDLFVMERQKRYGKWQKPRRLTAWNRDDLRPTVSPDGRMVAFYADSGKPLPGGKRSWDILVVPYKSGKTYRKADLEQMVVAEDVVIDLNTGPAWSPDSRKIFFVKRDPTVFNPIYGYDLYTGKSYRFKTGTRMNRDILMSKLGILSFRAQFGVWDRVFLALTNQGLQLQNHNRLATKVHYLSRR